MARTKAYERERRKWLGHLKKVKTKKERYPTGIPALRKPKSEEHKKAISEGVKKVIQKGIEKREKRRRPRRMAEILARVRAMKKHRPEWVRKKISESVKKTLQEKRERATKGEENNGMGNNA